MIPNGMLLLDLPKHSDNIPMDWYQLYWFTLGIGSRRESSDHRSPQFAARCHCGQEVDNVAVAPYQEGLYYGSIMEYPCTTKNPHFSGEDQHLTTPCWHAMFQRC